MYLTAVWINNLFPVALGKSVCVCACVRGRERKKQRELEGQKKQRSHCASFALTRPLCNIMLPGALTKLTNTGRGGVTLSFVGRGFMLIDLLQKYSEKLDASCWWIRFHTCTQIRTLSLALNAWLSNVQYFCYKSKSVLYVVQNKCPKL